MVGVEQDTIHISDIDKKKFDNNYEKINWDKKEKPESEKEKENENLL